MNFLHHILTFDENSPLLFTQFYFWAFFALVYALFALILGNQKSTIRNQKLHMRNVYLMFVSWFFYYKTSGLFLLILAFITLSDWLIARQIHKSPITHTFRSCRQAKNHQSPIINPLNCQRVWLSYLSIFGWPRSSCSLLQSHKQLLPITNHK